MDKREVVARLVAAGVKTLENGKTAKLQSGNKYYYVSSTGKLSMSIGDNPRMAVATTVDKVLGTPAPQAAPKAAPEPKPAPITTDNKVVSRRDFISFVESKLRGDKELIQPLISMAKGLANELLFNVPTPAPAPKAEPAPVEVTPPTTKKASDENKEVEIIYLIASAYPNGIATSKSMFQYLFKRNAGHDMFNGAIYSATEMRRIRTEIVRGGLVVYPIDPIRKEEAFKLLQK